MIRKVIQEACNKMQVPELANRINIVWSNRMTRTVGVASYNCAHDRYTIKFSRKLWKGLLDQEDIILHETAHIISYYVYGVEAVLKQKQGGHGPIWRNIAVKIGAKPRRYMEDYEADFALYRRKVKKYNINCSCGAKITLTQHMLTKIKNGSRHVCRKCRTLINPW